MWGMTLRELTWKAFPVLKQKILGLSHTTHDIQPH